MYTMRLGLVEIAVDAWLASQCTSGWHGAMRRCNSKNLINYDPVGFFVMLVYFTVFILDNERQNTLHFTILTCNCIIELIDEQDVHRL